MRRSRAPSSGLDKFSAAQFSAGYITNMFEFDLRQAQGASARNMREHRPPPRSVQCASQYAPCEEFGGGFASGPVSCEQRLRAAAISAVTMGQCTTSAMPENIKLLIFISSVDFVASTIGRWGAASCSPAPNSGEDLVDPRWPTISTSNRSGAARHAANAASAAVNPTGSYPSAAKISSSLSNRALSWATISTVSPH